MTQVESKIKFSDVMKSLNKVQQNLLDLRKQEPKIELGDKQKAAHSRYTRLQPPGQKNSQAPQATPPQRNTLSGWNQAVAYGG